MKLNDFFDKIFVINLERRPDRLLNFKKIADKLNIDFEVFNAYDGKKFQKELFYDNKRIEIKSNEYLNGCLGCLLSHLDILKKSKSNNYEKILILEDDVEFTEYFNEKFENFISTFDKNWDMLYFSSSLFDTTENFTYFKKLKSCYTTHSYGVHKNIIDKLIQNIESNLYGVPIDVTYSSLHPTINSYITIPFLTSQSNGFSDIQNNNVSYELTKKYL